MVQLVKEVSGNKWSNIRKACQLALGNSKYVINALAFLFKIRSLLYPSLIYQVEVVLNKSIK